MVDQEAAEVRCVLDQETGEIWRAGEARCMVEDDGTWYVHLEAQPGGFRVSLWRRVRDGSGDYEYVSGRGQIFRFSVAPVPPASAHTFIITEDEVAGMMVRRLLRELADQRAVLDGGERGG